MTRNFNWMLLLLAFAVKPFICGAVHAQTNQRSFLFSIGTYNPLCDITVSKPTGTTVVSDPCVQRNQLDNRHR